jgi:hypothetical protein
LRKEMMDQELCIGVSCDTTMLDATLSRELYQVVRETCNVLRLSGLGDDATYLAVKPRCRLVEEKEKLRLRGELHADSEKLALLNVQALARHTNHCARKLGHIEHLDDLLDVVVLLFLADVFWLPQHCTETKRLSHGSSL